MNRSANRTLKTPDIFLRETILPRVVLLPTSFLVNVNIANLAPKLPLTGDTRSSYKHAANLHGN